MLQLLTNGNLLAIDGVLMNECCCKESSSSSSSSVSYALCNGRVDNRPPWMPDTVNITLYDMIRDVPTPPGFPELGSYYCIDSEWNGTHELTLGYVKVDAYHTCWMYSASVAIYGLDITMSIRFRPVLLLAQEPSSAESTSSDQYRYYWQVRARYNPNSWWRPSYETYDSDDLTLFSPFQHPDKPFGSYILESSPKRCPQSAESEALFASAVVSEP